MGDHAHSHAVILVGHGGVPRDMPRAWVSEQKALARRAEQGGPDAAEARAAADALDQRIRSFPRSDETDPYRAGLTALGDRLRLLLGGRPLLLAYNEFCAPSLGEAIHALVEGGARRITVLTTMITRGGSHSEIDIPEAIAHARAAHPGVTIDFAWPLDLDRVAAMFAAHVPSDHDDSDRDDGA